MKRKIMKGNAMKSMLEQFNDIEDYTYYSDPDLRLEFDTFSNEQCVRFIEKYFITGGKGSAIKDIVDYFNDKNTFRASHSVSIYLMGLVFYNNCNELKDRINKQIVEIGITDFKYIWFLICLYHDYCSYIEIKSFNKNTDITCVCKGLDDMNNVFFTDIYSKQNIKSYYKHRKINGKIDHGIYGGWLLQKELRDNFERAKKKSETANQDDFSYNGLHWSTSHKNWYDFVASIIIKHNIWFANEDRLSEKMSAQIKEYENSIDNNMHNFIIRDSGRIKISDNPLLFLFFILDTIEPIKRYCKNDTGDKEPKEVLNAIAFDISFSNEQFTFRINSNNKFDIKLCSEIREQAKKMENWMDINVKIDTTCNTIIIKWK